MSEVIEITRSATKQQQCIVLRPSCTQPLPLLLLLLRVHTATAHSCPYCKLTKPCCCDHTQPLLLLRAHSPCCCKVTQPLPLAHTAPAVASAHHLLFHWPPNLLLLLYLLLCNYTKITIYTYIQSFQILCKTLAGTQFVYTGPGSSVTSNLCRRGCSPSSRSGGGQVSSRGANVRAPSSACYPRLSYARNNIRFYQEPGGLTDPRTFSHFNYLYAHRWCGC